jgi:N-acetylmuramoyl-L-alanine amidase
MRVIDYIFIHCSAGHGDLESMHRFWREVRGWKAPGYHRGVDYNGTRHEVAPLAAIVNGVKGYNHRSVHIYYRGGVARDNPNKAEDTRTSYQKGGLILAISDVLKELSQTQSINHIQIIGHRDASPDRNGNGVIEPWERIKECPSFDAYAEYLHLAPNKGPVRRNAQGLLA